MAQASMEIPAAGCRKTAVASVKLRPGNGGQFAVNRRTTEDYFPRMTARMIILQPLELTGTADKFDIAARVTGGGVSAQASALRHAISRALVAASANLRPQLKKAGLLTRDAREVERKTYGRHKARKRPQYSKR